MSGDRTEERLEAVLDALRAPARLDEIAQARVRARLEAALVEADAAEARTVGRWRRAGVAGGVGLAAAAAAVFAVVVAARTGERGAGERATAGKPAPAGGSAEAVTDHAVIAPPTTSGPAAQVAVGRVATGEGAASTAGAVPGSGPPAAKTPGAAVAPTTAVTVAAGESAQLTLGGAAVTVYGPGRLSPTPDGAVVEAAGIVVDRPRGDAPWSVRYHGVKIVVTHATFAIDHGHGAETRVSVLRGEIELHCASGSRTIHSGASATCEPDARTRVMLPRQASAPSPEGPKAPEPQLPEPQPRPEPVNPDAAVDRYATAESALRRGDLDAAQDALLGIVKASPDSLDAAIALLDLARLAARRGETSDALGYLARLEHHPRHAMLAAPAARLLETLVRSDPVRDLRMP